MHTHKSDNMLLVCKNLFHKLEMANTKILNTQSKLDALMLQDHNNKVTICLHILTVSTSACICMYACGNIPYNNYACLCVRMCVRGCIMYVYVNYFI